MPASSKPSQSSIPGRQAATGARKSVPISSPVLTCCFKPSRPLRVPFSILLLTNSLSMSQPNTPKRMFTLSSVYTRVLSP